MALDEVIKIIERALKEESYANKLFANNSTALDGYDLNENEKGMLRNLTIGPYSQSRRGLKETLKLVRASIEYSDI